MTIQKEERPADPAVKIFLTENGTVIGFAYLYLLRNELHEAPYGFLENVFVEEAYRGRGHGSALVRAAIDEARSRGCYKVIGTSRHDRPSVHAFYERLGFKNYGVEFRMDLSAV